MISDRGSDSWSSQERYAHHKETEDKIFDTLQAELPGEVKRAGKSSDVDDKVDWFWNGELCAIKVRQEDSGNDLLMDVFEPYRGLTTGNSIVARDFQMAYHRIASLNNTKDTIRFVDGKPVYDIINDMLDEFREKINSGEIGDSFENKRVIPSDRHPGCMFKVWADKRSGVKKLLAFIPPSYLPKDAVREIPFRS